MPRRSQFDMGFRPDSYWAPEDKLGEPGVEIARFEFKYGPLNQVRLLARPVRAGVGYKIGKGANNPYNAAPAETEIPLSFAEVIDMAEDGIRPATVRHFNSAGRSTGELLDFVSASSALYPELRAWYEQEAFEWARSRRLFSVAKLTIYAAMTAAALASVIRADALRVDRVDALAFAFFGLSILSLLWTADPGRCASQVVRWLAVGLAAFLVAEGYSLPACASLVAGGAALFLVAGLMADLRAEAYRPFRRYRFSGIGHPNWQAESCLLLLVSSAYLHRVGVLSTSAWIPLLAFTVVLLALTRSRTSFWVAVATSVVWTALELSLSLPPTGILMLLCLAPVTVALVHYGGASDPYVPGSDKVNVGKKNLLTRIPIVRSAELRAGWERRLGRILHLGRDRFGRRGLGGRIGLWRLVLEAIREKPLLGYGQGVFWTPAREQEVLRAVRWSAGSSHSIYLDTALNTGLVGFLLLVALLGGSILGALSLPSAEALFLLSFFFMVAIEGLFESAFVTPNFRSFSLFLLIFSVG